ncbi:MAG: molecular chaperone DnaJ [Deltaproteobacteria bacterium]|nr:MAG: molecular chaperone DnaJ [Pseudomonadota bacterium]PIE65990.1 MAG: molecular chaperone DnaJ [Deltaproteobacteria bacterium]
MTSPTSRVNSAGDLDHYQLLGVPPTATIEQIKAGYRRRALRLHPDKNPDPEATARFQACSEAYNQLSNAERRQQYDAQLMAEAGPGELFGGLVSDLLGGRFKRKRAGRNLRQVLQLSLEEAAAGVSRRITVGVDDLCPACKGSGAARGGEGACADCDGRGDLPRKGLLSLPQPCPGCGGQGRRVLIPCERCEGVGMLLVERRFDVSLPAGVRDGDLRVVPGQGQPGLHGGPPGDLHVVLHVEPHPLFLRRGHDIELELPVDIGTATLGGRVEVPTLDGVVWMQVPAGSQSGRVLRIRGKGISGGDLHVRVMVETPLDLDVAQRQALARATDQLRPEQQPRQESYRRALAQLREQRG